MNEKYEKCMSQMPGDEHISGDISYQQSKAVNIPNKVKMQSVHGF